MPFKGRVLLILENLPAPADRRAWQTAQALKEGGYRVTVISPKGHGYDKWHEVIDGVEVFRHPLPLEAKRLWEYFLEYPAALFWEWLLTFWVFLTRGFDVIHACDPPDLIFLIALPYKLFFGKKFVFEHRDLSPELFSVKFGKRSFWVKLLLTLERLSYRLADVAIVPNESYREISVKRNRFPAERVFVVRNAPRERDIGSPKPKKGLFPGRELIGYVGIVGTQERLETLVDIAEALVKKLGREKALFLVIGAGPALEDVKAYAKAKGLYEKHVKFLGYLSGEELFSTLSACKVCVAPDPVNEHSELSTMNKVIEYMALGRPVVMFETKEGRRSAGNAALYARPNNPVDFAEKIAWLLDHPEEAEEMGKRGRERFLKLLKWELSVPYLLKAYEKALGG